MGPERSLRAAAVAELQRLYDDLPDVHCKGLCADSCSVVMMSGLEEARLRERGVDLSADAVYRLVLDLADGGHPRCPALSPLNTCTQYDVRPLICRLYGAAEGLRCEHGCTSTGEVSRAAAGALIRRAQELSQRVGL